jgi:hypothetical protein
MPARVVQRTGAKAMTVADLILELQALPQHWRVVMPSDCDADYDYFAEDGVEVEEVCRGSSVVVLRGQP